MSQKRYRYPGLSEITQEILQRQGEAGRFEYKQNADALDAKVLVAAANAAAIERLPAVTILVGVAEQEDAATGVVTGTVVGLANIAREKGKLMSRAGSLRPVPPNVEIVEENVGTTTPILRVVVSPTHPPHYDGDGRRVTRFGASTRPITDEELLELYLDREADSFRERFRATTQVIEQSLDTVSSDVMEIASRTDALTAQLSAIELAADNLQGSQDETFDFVAGLDEAIGALQSSVDQLMQGPETIEEALARLVQARGMAMAWIKLSSELQHGHVAEVQAVFDELAGVKPVLMAYRRNLDESKMWRPLIGLDVDTPAGQWLEMAGRIRQVQAEAAD